MKVSTAEERAQPRSKRLRKKLHLGEFREDMCITRIRGFSDIHYIIDNYDMYIELLIEATVAQGVYLEYAACGQEESKDPYMEYSISKIGLEAFDATAVASVFINEPDLIFEFSELEDAYYCEIG